MKERIKFYIYLLLFCILLQNTLSAGATVSISSAATIKAYSSDTTFTGDLVSKGTERMIEVATFFIWNWADLAYLNVLMEEYNLNGSNSDWIKKYGGNAVLMQNLVKPGDESNNADGLHGGLHRNVHCTYVPEERRLGSYGYENYLNTNFTGNYDTDGDKLYVGKDNGWKLNRFAWDMAEGGNTGWIPIGKDYYIPFADNFDGQNFEINNLWIKETHAPVYIHLLGLFGFVSAAKIENLTVNADSIVYNCGTPQLGEVNLGVFAADVAYSEITNCHTTGVAKSLNSSICTSTIGGLIALVQDNSVISKCSSTVNIESNANGCGGLMGVVRDNGFVNNCFATGDISFVGIADIFITVGGLTGSFTDAELSNSYATGNITATLKSNTALIFNVGGLLGEFSRASAENCFSTGTLNVTAAGAADKIAVAGFAPVLIDAWTTNCYTTSDVSLHITHHNNQVLTGGFAAWTSKSYGMNPTKITNCYTTGAISATLDQGISVIDMGSAGLAAKADINTSITNSFALNPEINAPAANFTGRVVASNNGVTLSGNYAIECMLVNGVKLDTVPAALHHDIHGANIDFATATHDDASGYPIWDFTNIWSFVDINNMTDIKVTPETNLPVLQVFSITKPIFVNTVQDPQIEDCYCQNLPALTSPDTMPDICSGEAVNYAATANQSVTFTWIRAAVSGIMQPANSGTGATINEILYNSTNQPIEVTYNITMTNTEGCFASKNIKIMVKPRVPVSAIIRITN